MQFKKLEGGDDILFGANLGLVDTAPWRVVVCGDRVLWYWIGSHAVSTTAWV